MVMKVKIEGLKELGRALNELPKATNRSVCRRVLKEAGEPIARAARAKAPKRLGDLAESIDVSTKLAKSQRSGGAAMTSEGYRSAAKTTVDMYVGPGQHPQAITQEFGTFKEPAQPFMRPAWDAEKGTALDIITNMLWTEIEKSAARLAKKSGG
ncbi:HK97 gp10 family phage protein [Aureimonas altamirensis]|uniref:HK97-gp10 family putative phage morphogenesis protein n=1 Tax=Aureimonas altamirensis TaxID=370622 RepID=UPI002036D2D5|nr:HK97-gp10 family putative phage morphogenesis protein [Aureimonas altamirensis]MCM2506067.1 HK97 gp10 family phage protein [Aureimonas altamirensis]